MADLYDWGPPGTKLALYTSHYGHGGTVHIVSIDRLTTTQIVVVINNIEQRYRRVDGRQSGNRDHGGELRLLHDPLVQDALAVMAVSQLVFKLERTTFKSIRTRSHALAALRQARVEIARVWDELGGNQNDLT